MKNKLFISVAVAILILPVGALAKSTCRVVTCSQGTIIAFNADAHPTASETEPLCVKNNDTYSTSEMYFPKDITCKYPSYKKLSGNDIFDTSIKTAINSNCTNPDEILSQVVSCETVCNKTAYSDCENYDWDITGGHVYMITNYYKTGKTQCTCDRKYTTQCKEYYYGNKTDATSEGTCTRCPAIPYADDIGHTSTDGASDVTGCYVPPTVPISDVTGIYKFTENCYYKN